MTKLMIGTAAVLLMLLGAGRGRDVGSSRGLDHCSGRGGHLQIHPAGTGARRPER